MLPYSKIALDLKTVKGFSIYRFLLYSFLPLLGYWKLPHMCHIPSCLLLQNFFPKGRLMAWGEWNWLASVLLISGANLNR